MLELILYIHRFLFSGEYEKRMLRAENVCCEHRADKVHYQFLFSGEYAKRMLELKMFAGLIVICLLIYFHFRKFMTFYFLPNITINLLNFQANSNR